MESEGLLVAISLMGTYLMVYTQGTTHGPYVIPEKPSINITATRLSVFYLYEEYARRRRINFI